MRPKSWRERAAYYLACPIAVASSCVAGAPGTVSDITEGWPTWLGSNVTVLQLIAVALATSALTFSACNGWEPYRTILGATRRLLPVPVRYGSTEDEDEEPEDWRTVWLWIRWSGYLEFHWTETYRVVEVSPSYAVSFPEDKGAELIWDVGKLKEADGPKRRRYTTHSPFGRGLHYGPGRKPFIKPVLIPIKVELYRGFLMPDGTRKKFPGR